MCSGHAHCTLPTQTFPHPAPTSPRPWAFLFPTDISPLPVQLSTLAPGDAPPKKRGAGAGRAESPTPRPQLRTKPLPSSCQQPRPSGNARGQGQKEAGREEAAGGGGDASSPQSPSPSRAPSAAPGFWAYSIRGPKEKWGCHRLRRSGGAKGRGHGRVPDLAAGRRGPVPRCEAQWAWPSGPHDLHFAQKKARRGMRASRGAGLGVRARRGNRVPRSPA